MGWCSGTGICIDVWNEVREHIPENQRVIVLSKVIQALRRHDWDCEGDIEGEWPEADRALLFAGVGEWEEE